MNRSGEAVRGLTGVVFDPIVVRSHLSTTYLSKGPIDSLWGSLVIDPLVSVLAGHASDLLSDHGCDIGRHSLGYVVPHFCIHLFAVGRKRDEGIDLLPIGSGDTHRQGEILLILFEDLVRNSNWSATGVYTPSRPVRNIEVRKVARIHISSVITAVRYNLRPRFSPMADQRPVWSVAIEACHPPDRAAYRHN
jgi:hypothetical protein